MKKALTVLGLIFAVGTALAQNTYPPLVATTTYASLGATANNGTIKYCRDCAQTSPCTAGGTGSFAMRVNSAWECSSAGTGGGGALLDGTLCTDANGYLVRSASGTCVVREITNSDGYVIVTNPAGTAGDTIIDFDSTNIIPFSSGTADPPGTCTAPAFYFETDQFDLFMCQTTDTWSLMVSNSSQTDDSLLVANGTTFQLKAVADCDATAARLNYDTGTNAFSCATADIPLANIAAASGASKLLGRGSAGGAGDFEEITLGTGLTMTATTLSASTDPSTTLTVYEDFFGGEAAAGEIGSHGMSSNALSSGTVTQTAGTSANNPAVASINAHATNDNSGGVVTFSTQSLLPNAMWAAEDWSLDGVVYFGATGDLTNNGFWFGLAATGSGLLTSASGVWITRDTDLGHGAFVFAICDSATAGCQSAGDDTNQRAATSTITPSDNTAYRFRIRRAQSGVGGNPTIYMRVNDETELTFCSAGCTETLTEFPATTLLFVVGSVTRAASNPSTSEVDYVQITIPGLVRY